MNTLEECRARIDEIDNEIVNLLNRRMEVVRRVGEIKHESNTAIYRPEREKSIIDRLTKISESTGGLLNSQAIEAVFLEIFAVARNLELPERIAYLGPEGSFTHQAAESRFGAMSDYLSLGSIDAVFKTLEAGRAKFGVVPIENSRDGVVYWGKAVSKLLQNSICRFIWHLQPKQKKSTISSVFIRKIKGLANAESFCKNTGWISSSIFRSNRRQKRLF